MKLLHPQASNPFSSVHFMIPILRTTIPIEGRCHILSKTLKVTLSILFVTDKSTAVGQGCLVRRSVTFHISVRTKSTDHMSGNIVTYTMGGVCICSLYPSNMEVKSDPHLRGQSFEIYK